MYRRNIKRREEEMKRVEGEDKEKNGRRIQGGRRR
jgi:hypothetical protein